MGLPWIQVDVDFPRSLAARELAADLGVKLAHAVGLVVTFWAWCSKEAPDGIVQSKHAVAHVEEAAGWDGKRGRFAEAATDAGLLDQEKGRIRVRGWEERYSSVLTKAAKDADRKRAERAEAARKRRVDGAAPSNGQASAELAPSTDPSTETALERPRTARGESQTESQIEDLEPGVQKPEAEIKRLPLQDQDDDEVFWKFWCEFRAEHGLPVDKKRPRDFSAWASAAIADVGRDALEWGVVRFWEDKSFAAAGWPLPLFMSDGIWRVRAFVPAPQQRRQ